MLTEEEIKKLQDQNEALEKKNKELQGKLTTSEANEQKAKDEAEKVWSKINKNKPVKEDKENEQPTKYEWKLP